MEDLDTDGGIILKQILLEQGITVTHVLSYFHSTEYSFVGLTDYNNEE